MAEGKDDYENLMSSCQTLMKMINGKPKNINPLTKIPDPKMTLYGISDLLGKSIYYSTIEERDNAIIDRELPRPVTIAYYSMFAGKFDVIMLKDSNRTIYQSYIGNHYVAQYNHNRSVYKGQFVWEGDPGDLSEEYNEFKKRGITLINDVYQKETNRLKNICEMYDRHRLLHPQKNGYILTEEFKNCLEKILDLPFDILIDLNQDEIKKLVQFKLWRKMKVPFSTLKFDQEKNICYATGDMLDIVEEELDIMRTPNISARVAKRISYGKKKIKKYIKEYRNV